MLIAIGSDGNELTSTVAKRFGHAAHYLLYNTDTKKLEAVKNIDEDHSHSVLYKLIEKGVNAFIVGNIGPHAFEIVSSNNTKVFLARKMSGEEAITSYTNGSLEELTEPTVKKSIGHHGGHHHHGDGHCNHC